MSRLRSTGALALALVALAAGCEKPPPLDLTMMQTAIRFGRDNSWRLLPEAEHPDRFAFDDWSFDRHGFPRGPG